MRTSGAALHVPASRGLPTILVLAGAVLAGAAVAAASVLGPVLQMALVLVAGVGVPALLLFLVRPHLGLAAYLVILPLVLPWPIAAGLNAGETLTLAILVFGSFSLWEAQARVLPALRALVPVLLPMLGLAVVSVVSLIVNDIIDFEEVVSALFKVLAFGFVAVLVHMHSDTPSKARQLLLAALLGAALVGVYSVVEYMLGLSYDAEYDMNRAAGTFEHWNALGGFMALMSMPTLALAVTARQTLLRLVYGSAFVIEILAMLLSQTLGSVLALLIAGAVAIVFLVKLRPGRLIGGAILFLVPLVVAFSLSAELRDKIMRVDERVLDRLMTYAVGVNMFRDRFWFGFGSQQRVLDELWFGEADYGITVFGVSSSVPHNSFIAIGVEKGFIGALLFAVLIFGAFILLLRHRKVLLRSRHSVLYQGTFVGVLAFLVQNMTNDLILHARIGIVFWAIVVLVERLGAAAAAEERVAARRVVQSHAPG